MRRIYNYITAIVLAALIATSCSDYLDRTPNAETTEADAFSTYVDFQGYEDQMYELVVDYLNMAQDASFNLGDDVYRQQRNSCVGSFAVGDYWFATNTSNQSNIFMGKSNKTSGIWPNSWKGIRMANIALKNSDMLVQATDEEKALLRGQAYFFRAFFHWEIIRYWGGMPYITQAFSPDDNMKLTQPGTNRRPYFQETAELLVADLDSAAALLPADWDSTVVGSKVSNGVQSGMRGRATRGAAMGLKAKALIYAASPLMNKETTGQFAYNIELCKKAAEAANEVVELANQGVYSLLPFDQYNLNFYTLTNQSVFGKETLWARAKSLRVNKDCMWNILGALHSNTRWNDKGDQLEAPTQNIVDRFEMANGLPITEGDSGYDPAKPWDNRDPRFYKSILTDGTVWAKNGTKIETFKNGLDYGDKGSQTGYLCCKYWPQYWNMNIDKQFRNYSLLPPMLRLADVYLIYAEAANEAYGPQVTPTFENGKQGITSVEAVNRVRRRVIRADKSPLPDVAARFTSDKDNFRERIRVEREIELCFEGHRFDDIRRWHVAHLDKYKRLEGLEFDKDHTYYNRVFLINRIFEEKHYWLPLDRNDVKLYEGFQQNPGW